MIWINTRCKFDALKSHHVQKLNRLIDQKVMHKVYHSLVKVVDKISQHQLSTYEESLINKSLSFATTINWVPYLDIISPIEEIESNIPQAQADNLRWKVSQRLEKAKHREADNKKKIYRGLTASS